MAHFGVVLPFSTRKCPVTQEIYARVFRCVLTRLLFVTLISGTFLARVHAQTLPDITAFDQNGIQPYASYHGGDIDAVSLVNGSLTLDFPFLSYPQRGKLDLSFNLKYNNIQQHYGNECVTPDPCYLAWSWPLPGNDPFSKVLSNVYVGWAQGAGVVATVRTTITYDGNHNILFTNFFANWYVQTADGSKHVLGNQGTDSWTALAKNNLQVSSGPFETLDATGWRVIGPLTAPLVTGDAANRDQPPSTPPAAIVSPEGIQYSATQIQDPNGNLITNSVSAITDSLGRSIPMPPASPSSGSASTTGCIGQLTTAFAVLWTPPAYQGGTSNYKFCYAWVVPNMNPVGTAGIPEVIQPFYGLQSILLPNGQTWEFEYADSDLSLPFYNGLPVTFGTLSKVTLPTGGSITYAYQTLGHSGPHCSNGGRWVTSRTVNDDSGSHIWTYNYQASSTTVTDPSGNDTVHTFGLVAPCTAYETQTQFYQGSSRSGTLLKTTNTTYGYANSTNQWNYINLVPTQVTTAWQNGQTSQVNKAYDAGFSFINYLGSSDGVSGIYGKEISETASDYGSGVPGGLLRTTNTSYAWQSPNPNYASYLSNNLIALPYSVQVKDSGGTQRAYSYYGYDESSLQSSGIGTTQQHATGESHPGNQTSVHRWLNGTTTATTNCASVSSGYLVSNKVYFDTGEVQQSTDPCLYPTTYLYSPTYWGAYPTTVTNILGQSTNYGYDFNTGVVTSIQDPNLQTTTKGYDILARLTSVGYPDGGSTAYCYTDMGGCLYSTPNSVVATKVITSSPVLNETSTLAFDGLGRPWQTQLNSDTPSTTYTQATYDALGRKSLAYNPTRCSPPTTNCGETTWGYSTTNYDALSRVTSVVEQDGSTVSTDYSAFPCTTVTDEAGKARKSCVDGLGRMTGVWEVPSGANYETDYQYDVLGNLTYVNQKGSNVANARTRTFQYDSLSQLTSAANPESGTILYAYDADGNVITKTAPLPNQTGSSTVVTTSVYDKLNRLTKKSYGDGTTPQVQFAYDGNPLTGCTKTPPVLTDTYPIGRRTSMCDGSGATSWDHDQMGRVKQDDRFIGSVTPAKFVNFGYTLDGSLQFVTTPPLKTIGYTYNGAGRAIQALDSTDVINFVTSGVYAPPGGLTAMTLGSATGFAGSVFANAYNNRLQPVQLYASSPSGTVLNLCYDYHNLSAFSSAHCSFSANAGNNGNVFQVINNRDTTRTQTFTYDSLNRITSGQSSGSGSISWGENFTIDAWGNLYARSGITGKAHTEGLSCAANTNNQLTTCSYGYDAAGNMTSNPPTTYTYDAENRVIWTSGYRYIYDGDGERVEKCVAATSTTPCPTSGTNGTLYWRGTGSDTLDESDLSGNAAEEYVYFNGERVARRDVSTNAVHYYFDDHLGSTSLVTDALGTLSTCGTYSVPTGEDESDYYPYGGEIVLCNRVPQNYKFTGKERDSESGLDYFGARHYASALGRFMVPDWAAKPTDVPYANFGNPQSLNLYSYVQNNPTTLGDPDGHVGGVDDIAEAGIFTLYVAVAAAVIYESQPQNQRNAGQAVSQAFDDTVNMVRGWFPHPDNSGKNSPTPPTVPIQNVPQGTPGTTVTNVPQGTPPSTSQEGAVDTSPVTMAGGPKADDYPSRTAGGQAALAGGQKVGPSRGPQRDETNSNTREAGRNRALSNGSGAEHSRSGEVGHPHWHTTNSQGKRTRAGRVHHKYHRN